MPAKEANDEMKAKIYKIEKIFIMKSETGRKCTIIIKEKDLDTGKIIRTGGSYFILCLNNCVNNTGRWGLGWNACFHEDFIKN